ncbi:MAG: VPLPA-CTERM sorting domain-containing protein [Gammaproteobacteria bacterium]
MTIKPMIKSIAVMAVGGMMFNASANSVGFDAMNYEAAVGDTVSVDVLYDFTVDAMFGGAVNVIFDATQIGDVQWVDAELAPDAQAPASPNGVLEDGAVIGAGVGTFEFFNGMTSAGGIGTLTFTFLGGDGTSATTPCGMTLCLEENGINPFVSLAGQSVGADLLAAGNAGASVAPIPVPAAVWFMLSGLGALFGFGRKKA